MFADHGVNQTARVWWRLTESPSTPRGRSASIDLNVAVAGQAVGFKEGETSVSFLSLGNQGLTNDKLTQPKFVFGDLANPQKDGS